MLPSQLSHGVLKRLPHSVNYDYRVQFATHQPEVPLHQAGLNHLSHWVDTTLLDGQRSGHVIPRNDPRKIHPARKELVGHGDASGGSDAGADEQR